MQTETKMGRPKKFNTRKTMSFDLDEAMFDELVLCAEDRGQTKSEFVRTAIAHQLWSPPRRRLMQKQNAKERLDHTLVKGLGILPASKPEGTIRL